MVELYAEFGEKVQRHAFQQASKPFVRVLYRKGRPARSLLTTVSIGRAANYRRLGHTHK